MVYVQVPRIVGIFVVTATVGSHLPEFTEFWLNLLDWRRHWPFCQFSNANTGETTKRPQKQILQSALP